jgi:phage protein D
MATALPQHNRLRAYCKIIVNGRDVTDFFDPYLISVEVIDTIKELFDRCDIELDDRDARLEIPPDRAPVQVYLGWNNEPMKLVFTGFVHQVESGFGRKQGGRRLWIEARSGLIDGPGRDPQKRSFGEGDPPDGGQGRGVTLQEVLEKAGGYAGYAVKLAPALRNIERNYWQMNESFFHFGMRMAREFGAAFKVAGKTAVMVMPTDGLNVDGEELSPLVAEWGVNLIGWRIKPFVARPQAGQSETEWFNVAQGFWEMLRGNIGGSLPFGRADATQGLPAPAPNKGVGQQNNDATGDISTFKRGTGWCTLNGEPECLAGRPLTIIGARPGVDGTYTIEEAHHHYSRGGGYVTRCDLAHPRLSGDYYNRWREIYGIRETTPDEIEQGRQSRMRRPQADVEVGEPDILTPGSSQQ